jgi:hypothetical protein
MIIPGAGVLVMSGKQRERGELDMLHCVVLPVLYIAKLILGEHHFCNPIYLPNYLA